MRDAAEHRGTSPRFEVGGSLLLPRRACDRLTGILAVVVAAAAAAAAHAIRSVAAIVSAGPGPSHFPAFQYYLLRLHGLRQVGAGPRG